MRKCWGLFFRKSYFYHLVLILQDKAAFLPFCFNMNTYQKLLEYVLLLQEGMEGDAFFWDFSCFFSLGLMVFLAVHLPCSAVTLHHKVHLIF